MNNLARVREMMKLADAMNVDELITFFADDAVMELPFAPGRMEKEHRGKAAILEFQRFARDSFLLFTMHVDAIHETNDPNVIVCEHHSEAVVAENARPYRNRYVTFFTFNDDGLVTNWREYYDPSVVVKAFRP